METFCFASIVFIVFLILLPWMFTDKELKDEFIMGINEWLEIVRGSLFGKGDKN